MKEHIHNHKSHENIKIAFILNLIFSIIEVIGGFFTNSISILSDSIHDFGDSISIGVSYYLEKKSQKDADQSYTYGYLRYSLLGALITSIILLIGSILVIYHAIPRIINPKVVNYNAMIIFAIFGVIINGYAAYRTSHAEKHNEKAINLHMLEDVLGWIAVLIGSVCIKLFNAPIIDPILSIMISFYILYHVYKNIKEVFFIFMDKVPDEIKVNEIKNKIENKFTDIKELHHIHIWTIDGTNNYLTAHILLKNDLKKNQISLLKQNIKQELKNMNINHITIEIEYHDEKCDSQTCSK